MDQSGSCFPPFFFPLFFFSPFHFPEAFRGTKEKSLMSKRWTPLFLPPFFFSPRFFFFFFPPFLPSMANKRENERDRKQSAGGESCFFSSFLLLFPPQCSFFFFFPFTPWSGQVMRGGTVFLRFPLSFHYQQRLRRQTKRFARAKLGASPSFPFLFPLEISLFSFFRPLRTVAGGSAFFPPLFPFLRGFPFFSLLPPS